jgi:hypothetical protein
MSVVKTIWEEKDLCGHLQESWQVILEELFKIDQFGFLLPTESNWDTHRPFLWLALAQVPPIADVVELGSGFGSTPFLRKFCHQPGESRYFRSYDNNKEWCEKTGSEYVEDWDTAPIWQPCGLLFVDHAPGEHRWKAIKTMADKADIIVFHDSEIGGAGNYMYDKIYPLFKYQLHYNRHGGGAGASMVSNKIDVSKFKGLKLGQFQFDND